jgi:RNA polymerase sigma factor (sigma-70 family)
MAHYPDKWLATRTTLISRLRDWEDESSWSHFLDTYGPVVFGVALKSGLTPEDAEEVVQDTVIAIAKHVRQFRYDRSKGSFKAWILAVARSKMVDRWRKAQRQPARAEPAASFDSETTFIERLPDASAIAPDQLWEEEWKKNLVASSQQRLKETANPKHFQVFDCLVNKGWAPAVVADKFNIHVDQIYVIKQRMTAQLKEEVDRLRAEWGET